MDVALPPEVLREVRELVALGEFPDEAAAVVDLVRVGLSYRYRRSPSPGPSRPPEPPGPHAPGMPPDVNWIRRG